MYFAYALPWWAALLLVALSALLGYVSYFAAGPAGRDVSIRLREQRESPRSAPPGESRTARKALLAGLRALTLLVLLLVSFRPMLIVGQRNPHGPVVPILVDESRSMRIADADGRRRIDAAVAALQPLVARLGASFQPQVLGFGRIVTPADVARLSSAEEGASDIEGALRAVDGRYRGQDVAGVIVISDGAETEHPAGTAGDDAGRQVASSPTSSLPVFTIGVGGTSPDREVTSVTVGDDILAGSLVDLDAVVSSRGFGATPFDVRLFVRGAGPGAADRLVDVRHVTPLDAAPIHVRFPVAPDAAPAIYAVEATPAPGEAVVENNRATAVVAPPSRRRRILFVEGAPGFEHSFMARAWAADDAVEIDSVVRKGRNDQGRDAYFIQADPARGAALVGGFPSTRAALFVYDAIVLGSVEWDSFTHDQLGMLADFVSERGGGLLVLGARSFASPGLEGSALDGALPLERSPNKPAVSLTANPGVEGGPPASETAGDNKVKLTSVGREHPMTRVSATVEESERLWAALPSLAATTRAGAPRPGASVLAVTNVAGRLVPLLAVQRFGAGRTAAFTGEGSWRWKMLMPASDRTHEMFWRQALRWLSAATPDPVTIVPAAGAQPGQPLRLEVRVADAEFHPSNDATVTLRLTAPDGSVQTARAVVADATTGRYSARVNVQTAGAYHVEADARAGTRTLGSADRWFVAGASDSELSDPRLNEPVLRRIAGGSGGRYLPVRDAGEVPRLLNATRTVSASTSQPRDLWQHPLVFALIAVLLGTEWTLRRRWGLA